MERKALLGKPGANRSLVVTPGAIVMPLRGMDRMILIPGVALRSTPGYSHDAANAAKIAWTYDNNGLRCDPPPATHMTPLTWRTALRIHHRGGYELAGKCDRVAVTFE